MLWQQSRQVLGKASLVLLIVVVLGDLRGHRGGGVNTYWYFCCFETILNFVLCILTFLRFKKLSFTRNNFIWTLLTYVSDSRVRVDKSCLHFCDFRKLFHDGYWMRCTFVVIWIQIFSEIMLNSLVKSARFDRIVSCRSSAVESLSSHWLTKMERIWEWLLIWISPITKFVVVFVIFYVSLKD